MFGNTKQEQFILNARKQKAEKEKKKAVNKQKASSTQTTAKINVQKQKYDAAEENKDYLGKRIANVEANKARDKAGIPRYSSAVGDKQASLTKAKNITGLNQNVSRQIEQNASKPQIPKINKYIGNVANTLLTPMPALKNVGNATTKLMYGNLSDGAENVRNKIAQTAYGKGMYGVVQGISPIDTKPYIHNALSGDITDSLAFKAGDLAGTGVGFTVPYMGAEKAIGQGLLKAIPKLNNVSNIGQKVVKSVATDLTVGAPLNLNQAYNKEGLRGEELAKSMALNTALDIGVGSALEFVPMVLKSGKKVATKADYDKLPLNEKVEATKSIENQTSTPIQAKNKAVEPFLGANEASIPKANETPLNPNLNGQNLAKETQAPINAQNAELKGTQEYKLSGKSARYQKRGENNFIDDVAKTLGVNKYADKKGLKESVSELSEKLKSGNITESEKNELFEKMYDNGIVVSSDFYNKYKPLKDNLRNVTLNVTDRDMKNITDFDSFRRNNFNTIKVSKNDGVSIDGKYQELTETYPELFPQLNTTEEMLEQIADVSKSIKKTEETLDQVYGSQAEELKNYSKYEFDKSFESLAEKARTVQRYDADKTVKEEMQNVGLAELKQFYKEATPLQRQAEKMVNSTLLTAKDKVQVDRLLKGEITLEELPNGVNVSEIKKVYEAKKQVSDLMEPIKQYNKQRKASLRELADSLIETSDDWKDKKTGFQYAREMEERNFIDVAGKQDGEKIIKHYIEPVHVNEARSNTFKTEYREKVKALNLGDKKIYNSAKLFGTLPSAKGEKVSERALAQMYGEGKITAEQLQEIGADIPKIQKSVTQMRLIYNEVIDLANDTLIRNGYKPIEYRKDYFPHFTDKEPDSVLGKIANKLGFNIQIDELPTDIAGLTHTFKPGKKWFGFGLQRQTDDTVYDAVKGFDLYIEGVSDIIHHTDDIQNLRALENSIRYKYSKDGIKSEIDEILNTDMPDSLKESSLDEIYGRDKTHLGNLATHIRAYTDNLAGKKALEDRVLEHGVGRTFYNISKALENRVASNMVAVNPGSWLTNLIPLMQGTEVKTTSTLKALATTLQSYLKDDGFNKMSTFLINRKGSDPLWRTKTQVVSDTLSSPMKMIDNFTSEVLTRAKYYDEISNGATHDNAMQSADKFAASVIADRSKGGLPTIFNSRNPLSKLMTMFQVEVNNQYSYLFKDLPRNMQGKGKLQLTNAVAKYMIGAYVYNNVYESIVGRRPALDPIGMIQNFYENATDEEKTKTQALGSTATDMIESLPFVGGLLGGGRIPISSALPNFANLATAGAGLVTGDMNQKKALNTIGKEMAKPAYYMIPPTGGGQLKKVVETVQTVNGGGSYGMDAEGRDKLQFAVEKTPQNYIKGAVFGKYSLPGAQEWVEDGFKTMNADATEGYKKALTTGMKPNDYVEFYEQYKKLEPIKDSDGNTIKSKPVQMREAILKSDATLAQKNILDKFIVKSDKFVDFSSQENYDFSLLSKETRQKYLFAKNTSKEEFTKAYLAQKDIETSVGKAIAILNNGNAETAKALGISDTAIENAKALISEGVTADNYTEIADIAKPYSTSMGKAVAILSGNENGANIVRGLGMSDKTIQRAANLASQNITAKDYESYKESADLDNSDSIKKDEAVSFINSTDLTKAQKRALFMALCPNVKKIPY